MLKPLIASLGVALPLLALAVEPGFGNLPLRVPVVPPGDLATGKPPLPAQSRPRIDRVTVSGGCLAPRSRLKVIGRGFPAGVPLELSVRRGNIRFRIKTGRQNDRLLTGVLLARRPLPPGRYDLVLGERGNPRPLFTLRRALSACRVPAKPASPTAHGLGAPSRAPGDSQPASPKPDDQTMTTASREEFGFYPGNEPAVPPGNNPGPPDAMTEPPEDPGSEDDWGTEDPGFSDEAPIGDDTPPIPESQGSLFDHQLPSPLQAAPAVSSQRGPEQAVPGEVVTLSNDMNEAMRLAGHMRQLGLRVKRRRVLSGLGMVISVFGFPPEQPVDEMVSALRERLPEQWLDANSWLELQGDVKPSRWALHAIGFPSTPCKRNQGRIGLLDGPIDLEHSALRGRRIEHADLLPAGIPRADTDHATAIAVLLIGRPDMKTGNTGLVPEGTLVSGAIFRLKDGRRLTTVEWLLTGLDWLLQRKVSVIALPLGTPRPNWLLEAGIRRAIALGVPIVAAAGNGGPDAPPSWPAAYRPVVAVTAVDARLKIYRQANQGDYIDLAAPGAEIWVSNGRGGGRFFSGTSYAVPFVAAALLTAPPERLLEEARDLGEPGPDPVFGHGLLQWPECRP